MLQVGDWSQEVSGKARSCRLVCVCCVPHQSFSGAMQPASQHRHAGARQPAAHGQALLSGG